MAPLFLWQYTSFDYQVLPKTMTYLNSTQQKKKNLYFALCLLILTLQKDLSQYISNYEILLFTIYGL